MTINVNNINQCIINLLKEDGMEVSLRPKYINTFMHTNQPLRLLMDRHELTSATLNSCLLPSENPQSLAKLRGKGNKCPEAQNQTYLGSYLVLFFKKNPCLQNISEKNAPTRKRVKSLQMLMCSCPESIRSQKYGLFTAI